ncbi:MAG: SGNH/GDSL hydrolase family protein [Deltaproteobacteria bacterium]
MNHAILLGDSIFDNAVYVPGKPPVIEQLRESLPGGWKATLLAVDGDVTADVQHQVRRLPDDATHLIVSSGGNDALRHVSILNQSAGSVAEVLEHFTSIRTSFQKTYHQMIQVLKGLKKNLAVCTVYDCVPGYEIISMTALSMFNEIILREAFIAKVPVIDLRLICSDSSDYSEISSIEPSAAGGEKIVRAIVRLLTDHKFESKQSIIYT